MDSRLTTSGGNWYTPVNLEASREQGREIREEDRAFSEQYDAYFRWDLRAGFKLNSATKKLSHQFYIDFQNLTDRDNIFVRRYNRLTNELNQVNQVGLFVDFLYRVQF